MQRMRTLFMVVLVGEGELQRRDKPDSDAPAARGRSSHHSVAGSQGEPLQQSA